MTTYTVTSGQTSTGLTIKFSDILNVNSGGTVNGTVVNSGGNAYLSAGSVSNDTEVNSRGTLLVSGGTARNTVVNGHANEYIVSGGIAKGSIINSGGTEYIYSGGLASGTIINQGGSASVHLGGTTSGTVVNSGGNIWVELNTDVSRTNANTENFLSGITLHSGARLALQLDTEARLGIHSKDSFTSTTINGGTENIFSGGSVRGTVINSGGVENINSGGVANRSIVNMGGAENIYSGGIARGAIVNSGGIENINSGGVASHSVINDGGTDIIYSGGVAKDTLLNSGGTEQIYSNGIASHTIINKGGTATIHEGGVASATIISAGGTETVLSGGAAINTLVNSGGQLNFEKPTLLNNITFNVGATLDLLKTLATDATVNQLNQLVISNHNSLVKLIQLTGDYSRIIFVLSKDGKGGTLINELNLTRSVNDFLENNNPISPTTKYIVEDFYFNIAKNLDKLQSQLANLKSLFLYDSSTALPITATQLINDEEVINLINAYILTVSDVLTADLAKVATNSHVVSLSVKDSTLHITNNLNALKILDDKLTGITVSNPPSAISITPSQSVDFNSVLNKISDTYNLKIIGTKAADTLYDTAKSHATLVGGAGIDTFNVSGSDAITDLGKGGADILKVTPGALVNATITNPWTASVETVNQGTVTIKTNGLNVNLSAITKGTSGYKITDTGGASQLTGSAFGDLIIGGTENDTLKGGLGNDTLTGGKSHDVFVFNTKPNNANNVDILTDFASSTDHLQLSKAIFSGLKTQAGTGNGAVLAATEFVSSNNATHGTTANSHLIYNNTSGVLYYDADGNGTGAAVKVAILGTSTHPALVATDILIIA